MFSSVKGKMTGLVKIKKKKKKEADGTYTYSDEYSEDKSTKDGYGEK